MKAKTKVTIKFYARLIGGYLTWAIVILAFSWLFDKVIETLCMIAGYAATRFLVPKIKHFNTTQKCISVSTATFLFALAIICIPSEISILWNIGVGACIPLIMYAESLLFDVKLSDEELLIKLCKAKNYNEIKTEMAIRFFIKKEKPKDVWLWLLETKKSDIEWDSVRRLKCIMKKELFK